MKIRNIMQLPVLAEGGEGILYDCHGEALKWYKPCVNLDAKRRKVQLLMKEKLPPEAVCPVEEVFDRKGNFAGYTMKKVLGEEFRMLSNKRFVSANHITTKEILEMLVRIREVLGLLHSRKIYVGDLNDRNILFDSQYHIYLIDCDSWSVGAERCEVAMDLFQDPELAGNEFNEKTDTYAFCVLAWKALTRVHPFGGTMDPDRNLADRMKERLSVIDRPSVKLPRSVRSWRNLSPQLVSAMKRVFEDGERRLGTELEELLADLKYCTKDGDYYYGKYMTCPLCDEHARVLVQPVSCGTLKGLKLTAVRERGEIHTVLNRWNYVDQSGQVTDVRSGKKAAYISGQRYHFTKDGTLVTEDREHFVIHGREPYAFEKRFKSSLTAEGNRIFYLNPQGSLCEVTVYPQGNSIRKLCQCGNTAYFEVKGDRYCAVSIYENRLILQTDRGTCELLQEGGILNYGIHGDPVSDSWLIVLENNAGIFRTLILSGMSVLYDTTQIRYACALGNLCLWGNIIYFPTDGRIRGYAYQKDLFKDFACDIVDTDSGLVKEGKRFIIINNENIYELG